VTFVDSLDCDELRVILCLEFDPNADPRNVAELKGVIIDSPNTLHSVEAAGDFDFITEVAAQDLGAFNRWWKTLARLIASVVRRCEKSFVCKRFIRRPKNDLALWVRTGDELRRIDHSVVDKVIAEGDYARVYAQGQSWLLHTTMHSLCDRLGSKHFVQLHRSIIVRSGFIDRLVHQGRHWAARLRDGSFERIAKSHVTETLKMTHSSNGEPDSSKLEPIVEQRQSGLTKN
jgi:hypothetical protein